MSIHADMDAAYWAEGPGAMCWRELQDDDGVAHLALMVRLPGDQGASPIYPMHQPNNWCRPGPKFGWNGDRERPTFRPSIQMPDGWHGFITHGELTAEPCPDTCHSFPTEVE